MEEVEHHLGDHFEKTDGDCQRKATGEDKYQYRRRHRRPGAPGNGLEDRAFFGFVLHKISGAWRVVRKPFINLPYMIGNNWIL